MTKQPRGTEHNDTLQRPAPRAAAERERWPITNVVDKGRGKTLQIHYLEVVTKEVDAVCAAYAAAIGVCFRGSDAKLGKARTAALPGGGLVGVRAPMHESEEPVVRPYWLVENIDAALAAAVKASGEIGHPPMEIPGHGTFAIYIHGGIHHGLWKP